MLQLRFASQGGLELCGSVAQLQAARAIVSELLEQGVGELELEMSCEGDPSPYDIFLSRLIVRVTKGTCRISVDPDDGAVIEGSTTSLWTFESVLNFPQNARQGDHLHFEHTSGVPTPIAPESEDLLVTVWSPESAA